MYNFQSLYYDGIMKIRLEDIPETGLELDLTEEGSKIADMAGGLDFTITEPVTAHMEIMPAAGAYHVDGSLKATLRFECGRCTKPFDFHVDSGFSLFFMRARRNGADAEHNVELKRDDLEVNYLEVPEIDTSELILAQLALESPVKPLCSEDCLGLCPTCGADLNEGACGCERHDPVDNRFAALKDFKVKK